MIIQSRGWHIFVWLIGLVTLGLYSCQWDRERIEVVITEGAGTEEVIYFIPDDPLKLDPNASIPYGQQLDLPDFEPVDLLPEALQAFDILSIEATSEWNVVTERVLQGKLKGVIIHHEALPTLTEDDLDSLRLMFRSGIVVGGIGIPGDFLASDILGMPHLFQEITKYGYSTPYYYYIFQIHVDATPEEQARLIHALEQGATFEEAMEVLPADSQATTGYGSATDDLFHGKVEQLLRVFKTKNTSARYLTRTAIHYFHT